MAGRGVENALKIVELLFSIWISDGYLWTKKMKVTL